MAESLSEKDSIHRAGNNNEIFSNMNVNPGEQTAGEDSSFSNCGDDTSRSPEGSTILPKRRSQDDFTARETRNVKQIKAFLIVFLLACIGLVGWGVYTYTRNEEEKRFEDQFQEDAKKVLETLGTNLELVLESLDAFSVSMISYARAANQTWPFVVIPDFAVRAEKIRALSNAIYITTYPLVEVGQRDEWELFTSLPQSNSWVQESIALQEENPKNAWPIVWNYTTWDVIHAYDEFDKDEPGTKGTNRTGPWLPLWQIMPVIPYDPPYNWDLNSILDTEPSDLVFETHEATLSAPYLLHSEDSDPALIEENIDEAEWVSDYLTSDEDPMEPISDYYYPIIDHGIDHLDLHDGEHYESEKNRVVGLLSVSVYWRDALKNILPESSGGIVVVVDNECSLSFTYRLDGGKTKYLGGGDHHDEEYDDLELNSWLLELRGFGDSGKQRYSGRPLHKDHCPFFIRVYPSDDNKSLFTSQDPIRYAAGAMLIFILTSLGFVLYDTCVERRHRRIKQVAVKSKTVVESLFPEFVRQGVEEEAMPADEQTPRKLNDYAQAFPSFVASSMSQAKFPGSEKIQGKPLADLFPNTTIFFADIAGFTAWSSVRKPDQVFNLLETLYAAFDRVADKRQVFKVETIGDCYVAVTGLPTPQDNHPVIMTLFARDCRDKMKLIVQDLETTLGPGTADLRLRIGLHSGSTTASVLRGKKARFQLFGDTVNTASRMESLGMPNLIHVSQKTADLLIGHGKGHWLRPREDLVNAKGKGMLQTFFVEPKNRKLSGSSYSTSSSTQSPEPSIGDTILPPETKEQQSDDVENSASKKATTLIDWNTQLFEGLLEDVVVYRRNKQMRTQAQDLSSPADDITQNSRQQEALADTERKYQSSNFVRVRDQVDHDIKLPKFLPCLMMEQNQTNDAKLLLSKECRDQLHGYIKRISCLYPNLPFHNLEHASHSCISLVKLLQQISTKEATTNHHYHRLLSMKNQSQDDYTSLILDPSTKFAIVFSMLIHDCFHPGVSNAQLVKEDAELARLYSNRSVSELNSFNVAWALLMEDSFKDLRATIYTTLEELDRFRNLVIKCVLATDLMDKQLKTARDDQWEKAFEFAAAEVCGDISGSELNIPPKSYSFNMGLEIPIGGDDGDDSFGSEICDETWNSKALVVIDHLVQASDLAYTLQHWHVYKKWNGCLFKEMRKAYMDDRSDNDPAIGWFEGELKFFDNVIIPLARKLKQCEVFGLSCDSFLEFAIANRTEWMVKGNQTVHDWLEGEEGGSHRGRGRIAR